MAERKEADGGRELDRRVLDEVFAALDHELGTNNASAEIYVVGGARMAYGLNPARRTMDVDALFRSGRSAVENAAATVQKKHELRREWLNEGVVGLLPAHNDHHEVTLFAGKNLKVQGASPQRMLALKVCSLRNSDWKDIKPLMTATGATTFDRIKKLVQDEYRDAGPGAEMILRLRLPTLKEGLEQKKDEIAWQAETDRLAPPSRTFVEASKATSGHQSKIQNTGEEPGVEDRPATETDLRKAKAATRGAGQPVGGTRAPTAHDSDRKYPSRNR